MTTAAVAPPAVPGGAEATEPPEARGIPRDAVRLLVASATGMRHARFDDLPDLLTPGDLLVVNTSATLPAAVEGRRLDGRPVTVHFSAPAGRGDWLAEIRPAIRATGPVADAAPGERIELPAGVVLELRAPRTVTRDGTIRLWRVAVGVEGQLADYLALVGRPIRYGYVPASWPISDYQTVFAREPGSAEMPSAGRPFTSPLVTRLVSGGVLIAPILLHTGVSSLDDGEPPQAERYRVPDPTAALVNLTRRAGRRVIAVGTTVTRALETVTDRTGTVHGGAGWTKLVLGPDRRARVVDGLITGWHAPGASHLLLLEAVVGADRVTAAYQEAVSAGYLWHEFGDSALLLADAPPSHARTLASAA
jgi:S-adenosylmethionine:tRNA ribosyltransferase-isomerase